MKPVYTMHFSGFPSPKYSTCKVLSDSNDEYLPAIDAVIMQYTGVKDKNGKEIYEGDILKHKESYLGGVVKFSEGMYPCFYNYDLFHEGEEFEIIGNIYENPELLESN